jgi:hypothetical protein
MLPSINSFTYTIHQFISVDPFNRQLLSISMVEPVPELKQRIQTWLEAKIAEQQQTTAVGQDEMTTY